MPTLRTIVNAPRSSPLAKINVTEVVQFFVTLLATKSDGESARCSMRERLCLPVR